jgi:hypothetical protein
VRLASERQVYEGGVAHGQVGDGLGGARAPLQLGTGGRKGSSVDLGGLVLAAARQRALFEDLAVALRARGAQHRGIVKHRPPLKARQLHRETHSRALSGLRNLARSLTACIALVAPVGSGGLNSCLALPNQRATRGSAANPPADAQVGKVFGQHCTAPNHTLPMPLLLLLLLLLLLAPKPLVEANAAFAAASC